MITSKSNYLNINMVVKWILVSLLLFVFVLFFVRFFYDFPVTCAKLGNMGDPAPYPGPIKTIGTGPIDKQIESLIRNFIGEKCTDL